MHRGLVLVPEFTVDVANNSLQLRGAGGRFMESMVKQNLPYWDKFDLPDNPIYRAPLTPSLQYLQSEGIVRKSYAGAQYSGAFADVWVRSQFDAWRMNEEREPGAWTMAQQGDFFWLPRDERARTRTIEATLYKALPVPSDETAFEDILEFKARRSAELQTLRSEIDTLYLELVSSEDIPRATTTALTRLSKSLEDVDRVTAEAWTNRLRSTLRLDISLTNVGAGATVGAASAASFAYPIELGAAIGAAGAIIRFELKPDAIGARPSQPAARLTYARRVERDLGQA